MKHVLISESRPDSVVVPLFWQHPETNVWYGAVAVEVDWLLPPQLVFYPLDEISHVLRNPQQGTTILASATVVSLEEYLRMHDNA